MRRRLLRRDQRRGAAPARFGLKVGWGLRVLLAVLGERRNTAQSRTSDSRSARGSSARMTRETMDTYTTIAMTAVATKGSMMHTAAMMIADTAVR